MQMRCIYRGISGCPYIPNDVSMVYRHTFLQTIGVSVEMSVVVAEVGFPVKFVNRQAARFAKEEFPNYTILHSQNGSAARRRDIHRLMGIPAGPALLERILYIASAKTAYGQCEIPPQESLVI